VTWRLNTVCVVLGSKPFQSGIEIVINGHLKELESVGENVVKSGFLLVLDEVPKGADVGTWNFHCENATGIIVKD
jgi:hypothetical protein